MNKIISIHNLESEGEFCLKNATPLKIDKLKYILNIICALFSLGAWFLIQKMIISWSPQIEIKLLFSESNIDECSHFLVSNFKG